MQLKINKGSYIYTYNATRKDDNVFLKENRTNYIFTYDSSTKHLEIHKYTLSRRNINKK